MKNRKIRTRLLSSYLLMFAFISLLSAFSFLSLKNLKEALDYSYNLICVPMDHMVQFSIPYGQVRSSMRDLAFADTAEAQKDHIDVIETNFAILENEMNEYLSLLKATDNVSPEEIASVEAVIHTLAPYKAAIDNKLIPYA